MRIPRTPPALAELLVDITRDPAVLQRLVGIGPATNGRYHHWDKLQHLTPPTGLTHRTWWLALKLARSSSRRPIPLLDERGRNFWFITHDVVARSLHAIDRHSGHVKTFEPQIRGAATRTRYILSNLTNEAIASSQLEGASTTVVVAKEMLRSGRPPIDSSERMILRNYEAMRYVVEKREEDLTLATITRLLAILEPEARIRKSADPVMVVDRATGEPIHHPPPADAIDASLASLCAFANEPESDAEGFLHPVLRAIAIHFWIGYLHPFTDGNGRTARALFYWSMLRQGYWLWEYISISKILKEAPAKYARAYLYSENDDADLTYFALYNMAVMKRALADLEDYLAKASNDLEELQLLLRKGVDLNHRQLAILSHAIKDQDTVYTFRWHMNSHGIAYQTARTDLLGLVESGFLEPLQRGKRHFFRAPKDLSKRVRSRYRR